MTLLLAGLLLASDACPPSRAGWLYVSFGRKPNLAFGPDGKLSITPGDGGAPDPSYRAQNHSLLTGKVLRLNDDGSIPSDNPFIGQEGARDEIFAVDCATPGA